MEVCWHLLTRICLGSIVYDSYYFCSKFSSFIKYICPLLFCTIQLNHQFSPLETLEIVIQQYEIQLVWSVVQCPVSAPHICEVIKSTRAKHVIEPLDSFFPLFSSGNSIDFVNDTVDIGTCQGCSWRSNPSTPIRQPNS